MSRMKSPSAYFMNAVVLSLLMIFVTIEQFQTLLSRLLIITIDPSLKHIDNLDNKITRLKRLSL